MIVLVKRVGERIKTSRGAGEKECMYLYIIPPVNRIEHDEFKIIIRRFLSYPFPLSNLPSPHLSKSLYIHGFVPFSPPSSLSPPHPPPPVEYMYILEM